MPLRRGRGERAGACPLAFWEGEGSLKTKIKQKERREGALFLCPCAGAGARGLFTGLEPARWPFGEGKGSPKQSKPLVN